MDNVALLLQQECAEGASFSNRAISSHLRFLGYPEISIKSMLLCGSKTGESIVAICGCGNSIIDVNHHCNLRTCSTCSQRRKRRIVKRYLPYLVPYKRNALNFLYSLTISPENYQDLDYGMDHIRRSFSKFLRLKYVRERIKAGLYVIECKNVGKGWNIHIHAIIYGRYLDNRIRGKCLDCGQSLLKGLPGGLTYYCANRRCNSTNVEVYNHSKIASLWADSSGMRVNIHISRLQSVRFTLNYMLKYVSVNKDEFLSIDNLAHYIVATRKRKLINVFGLFFNSRPGKEVKCFCWKCEQQIQFVHDREVQDFLMVNRKRPPVIMLDSFTNGEAVVLRRESIAEDL